MSVYQGQSGKKTNRHAGMSVYQRQSGKKTNRHAGMSVYQGQSGKKTNRHAGMSVYQGQSGKKTNRHAGMSVYQGQSGKKTNRHAGCLRRRHASNQTGRQTELSDILTSDRFSDGQGQIKRIHNSQVSQIHAVRPALWNGVKQLN